ncbi:hypothetical protein ACFX59_07895 [Sphingomonas sp. NCPPB 2930]|uniref:hypothetical protein n=1 Tax=unclassified Sphingomonas TaxID=196159 RepID=UPI0033963CC8
MMRRRAFPLILLASIAPLAGCSPKGTAADNATLDNGSVVLANDETPVAENEALGNDLLTSNDADLNSTAPQ